MAKNKIKEKERIEVNSELNITLSQQSIIRSIPSTNLEMASMLKNLGGFIADLGLMAQQRAEPDIPNKERHLAAKANLIEAIKELRDEIQSDAIVVAEKKKTLGNKMSEAIGLLRACNRNGFSLAYEVLFEIIPLDEPYLEKGRKLWMFQILILAKLLWDEYLQGTPTRNNRVVHDPYNDVIIIYQEGDNINPIRIPVDRAQDQEARDIALELDRLFKACNYPTKELSDRLQNIRRYVL